MAYPSTGRSFILSKNSIALAGIKEKSFSINNESIDITSDDDAGWRKLLSTQGVSSIEISGSGVVYDNAFRKLALLEGVATPMLTDIELEFPDGDTLAGDFFLSTYEESGSTADQVTFSITLMSSGAPTFTESV